MNYSSLWCLSLFFGLVACQQSCIYDWNCTNGAICRNTVCVANTAAAGVPISPGVQPVPVQSVPGTPVGVIPGQPIGGIVPGTGIPLNGGCARTIDCLAHGIYFECKKNKCVKSDHKICRSDDDCRKNLLNKRCVNNRCSILG